MNPPTTARVEHLVVSGEADVWRRLGFVVSTDGVLPLYGTSLRIVPGSPGLVGWELSGIDQPDPAVGIDGLDTLAVDRSTPTFGAHDIGAVGIDHVVVLTNDLERTSAAIASATGCELKRVREVEQMRQGFHRIGSGGLIVEIVERSEVEAATASFWGFVLNVEDLDYACALLGEELIGAPKDAVQPGRRIATLRTAAGLGVPLALMTP